MPSAQSQVVLIVHYRRLCLPCFLCLSFRTSQEPQLDYLYCSGYTCRYIYRSRANRPEVWDVGVNVVVNVGVNVAF